MVTTQGRPTGTVTFLLTDLVGSTRLWQDDPTAMSEAVAEHERIIRDTLGRWNAYEFGTAGDSFAAAFSSAVDAVNCAAEIQQRLSSHDWGAVRLAARVGVHTGQADERDGRYFGSAVNLAARVCDLAEAGQVFVSEPCRVLVGDRLSNANHFVDLGRHAIESFDQAESLFAVVGPGLSDPEPLDSSESSGNLPTPATTFVGRAEEVDAITGLVEPGRAVTIVGLGGLGKTRISIEVANRCRPANPDGIWWIDLAPIADGTTLAQLVATTLGATQQPGLPPIATVTDWLKRRSALLVFDNCEHVSDDAAGLVASLLDACPGVSVVASSRTPLAIAAEKTWPLRVLDAPTDGTALLIERARLLDPTLDPRRWPEADLVRLCERLDGLPLAIEMAAARLRALSPAEILDRLDDRFRLLKNRDRHAAGRHQTLLGALDWSYGLLAEDEQLLLDRLSVFPGEFDLRAVERVCADRHLDEFDVLDLLSALVDNSLVALAHRSDGTRYRLLESVRHYGSSHLSDGEAESLRARLVEHIRTLCVHAGEVSMGEDAADVARAYATFDAEWDNIREAIRWAISFKEAEAVEDIVRAIWDFSFQRFRTEVNEWCRPALELPTPPMSVYTLAATNALATADAMRLIDRALAHVDDDVPDAGAALCLGARHWFVVFKGGAPAIDNAERGLRHAHALGRPEVAWQHANLASLLLETDPERAATHAAEALDYVNRSDNPLRTTCVPSLAVYEAGQGRPGLGYELCDRSVDVAERAGQLWTSHTLRAQRAAIAMRYGVGDPAADLHEALTLGRRQRAWYAVWLVLGESLDWLRANCGDELAAIVGGHMAAKGIWFRGSTDDAHVDPIEPEHAERPIPRRRDDLIDLVLEAVEERLGRPDDS